ncbi:MAG: S-layer homology domain-containing protein, partial [Chloroflexia bacterium]
TQLGELWIDGIPGTCAAPEACPGLYDGQARHYDSYTLTNEGPSPACITINVDAGTCTGSHYIFVAAYLGAYDPTNLCENYIADIGSSPQPDGSFSFTVPGGRDFTIVAYESMPNGGCPEYHMSVSGLPDCPVTGTPTPRTSTPTPTRTPTNPAVETCGPNANYSIAQGVATLVPGTQDTGNHCFNCVTHISLPFPYTLYGQEFSEAYVSASGNLQFTSANPNVNNTCLPNQNFNNTIFADWEWLNTRTIGCPNCGIFTSVSGSAPNRIFNVEWRARLETPTGMVNFEIRLYEGQSRFDLVYGQMDQSGSNSLVGVQRDTGSHYTQYSCNQSTLVPGLLLTFTQRACPTPTGTPPTATVTRTPTITPTPTAACGPNSNYYIEPGADTLVPGTVDTGNHCDDCTTAISLPFTYNFYGRPFTTAWLSSNGNLQFGSSLGQGPNVCLPASGLSDSIFAYWTNLSTEISGFNGCAECGIYTSIIGSAPNRIFNVEWRANVVTVPPTYTNFEIRLYEGQSRFDLVYGQVDDLIPVDYTVGAQQGQGSQYAEYVCGSGLVQEGLRLAFSQQSCTTTFTPTRTPSPTATLQPVATCGPDSNYIVYQTTGQLVPGTVDTGNHCEFCTTSITLPFTYNFYGQPFTSARVSSSGNLQFTSNIEDDPFTTCLPNSAYNNVIFAHWATLYTGNEGDGVFTSVSGSAPNRIFNIEWRAVEGNGFDRANFEIRLYEANGRFDIVYGDITNGGVASTVGAQRDTGSHFTQYTCHAGSAVLDEGLLLVFEQPSCTPPTPTATITPGGPTLTPTATATPTLCGNGDNYTVAQMSATIVPGSVDTGNHCDDCVTAITLPFAYNLYGRMFTTANVSANGNLQFNSNSSDYLNHCLPATGMFSTILGYWADLSTYSPDPGAGVGIFTSVSGAAPNRIFNVEWRTCLRANGQQGCTAIDTNFEIRLYEGQTRFEVVYGTLSNGGRDATVGVQRGFGGVGQFTQYECNAGGLTPGLALMFSISCGTPQATATGTVATATPTTTPSGPHGYLDGPGRVPAERMSMPFAVNLFVDTGSESIQAAQSYITFPAGDLRVVDGASRTCSDTNRIEPDLTVLNRELQNEVCNGPAPCVFRGNVVQPGSIAFASAVDGNQSVQGNFHVARITFCAAQPGNFTLRWQFTPPAPPNRNSAILNRATDPVAVRSLYQDYVLEVGEANIPTSTPATLVPTGTATITRTPAPAQFSDVQTSDYFYTAVTYLASRGVISGYLDGTFRPYNNATRGQLCKIAVLAEGWPLYTPPAPTFTDVPRDQAFYQYVETAYQRGIISGYADHTFRPGNNVTRGQLSKIIVNARGWAQYAPTTPTFRDVPAAQAFYPYIETAYRHAIISGYDCGAGCLEFRPSNNATRGQISKIVHLAVTQP